jgi:hypothetical protein
VKSHDARLYYALLGITKPDLWDDVVGGYVSCRLTNNEQTYIIEKRIGIDKLKTFIDEAREFFLGTHTIYYKRSKWTVSPIQCLIVENELSTIGCQFLN